MVFSLKTNTFKDDEFSKRVTDIFNTRIPLVMLSFILPSFVAKFLDLSPFNSETIDYFAKLTLTLVEERKKNKEIVYNDFIEMLLKSEIDGEVRKQLEENGHINRELSIEEIVGRC